MSIAYGTIRMQSRERIIMLMESRLGPRLVIIASIFNVFLCFVSTRYWLSIGTTDIILVEMAILIGGVFAIRNHITKDVFQIACLIVGYMIGIKLINPGADLKILHDVAIMYIFYKLGTLASIEMGNRTLWAVMIIVLAGGFFELLLPTTFGNIFNVW